MSDIQIEVKGLGELQKKMRRLFAGDSRHIITYLNQRLGRYIQGALQGKPYPPERTGQRYRRTGTLNRSWKTILRGRNTIVIRNPARQKGDYYADWVVGDKQAWMHRDRWWQARTVAEEKVPDAMAETEQYIESIWNSG